MSQVSKRRGMATCCVVLSAAVSACDSICANGQTWDGGGTNSLFSNPINWVGNVAPVNTGLASVVFSGSVRTSPSFDIVSPNLASITFNSASTFTLGSEISDGILLLGSSAAAGTTLIGVTGSGGALITAQVNFHGNGTVSATGSNLTLTNNLYNTNNTTLTLAPASGRTITLGSNVTGLGFGSSSLLRVAGAGTVAYQGLVGAGISGSARVQVESGTLRLTSSASSLPNTTVTGTGTLIYEGSGRILSSQSLRVLTLGTVNFSGDTSSPLQHGISMSGGLLTGSARVMASSATVNFTSTSTTVPVVSAPMTIPNMVVEAGGSSRDVIFAAPLDGELTTVTGSAGYLAFSSSATGSTLSRMQVDGPGMRLYLDASPVAANGTVVFTGVSALIDRQSSGTTVNAVEASGIGLSIGANGLSINRLRYLPGATGSLLLGTSTVAALRAEAGSTVSIATINSNANVSNAGLVSAVGVNLTTASFTNEATGTLSLSGGNTTVVSSPLANTGTVSLLSTSVLSTTLLHNGGLLSVEPGGRVAGLELNGGTISGTVLVSGSGVNVNQPLAIPAANALQTTGAATFTNRSTITLAGGSMSAGSTPMVNLGSISGAGSLSAGTFDNRGTWTITDTLAVASVLSNSSGQMFVGTGLGNLSLGVTAVLSNTSVLTLDGGMISGGFIENSVSGQIVGRGTISSAVINSATIRPSGGTILITGALQNSGTIRVTPDGSIAGDAVIQNTGRIQGDGLIGNTILNAAGGRIEPKGTLVIAGQLAMVSGSQVQATLGNTLVLQGGLSGANSGMILLSGGSMDAGTNNLTNAPTGQITGWGNLNAGSLTNNGSITFTGGSSLISSAVTNMSGRTIRVQAGTAIFTSSVTNNGTLQVLSGEAVFTGTVSGSPTSRGLSNALIGAGFTTVQPGALLQTDGLDQSALSIMGTASSPGQVNVLSRQPLGFTPAAGRNSVPSTSILGTLTIAQSAGGYVGGMDLADNNLILTSTTESATRAMVASWWNRGLRNGPGLGSSFSTNGRFGGGPDELATLGVISNDNGAGGMRLDEFDGVSLTSSVTLVKYTYIGDTNLDGIVGPDDLGRLLDGLRNGRTGWWFGDTNYDGVIDSNDLANLLKVMRLQSAPFGSGAGNGGVVGGAVPEPGGALLGMVAVGATLTSRRRR